MSGGRRISGVSVCFCDQLAQSCERTDASVVRGPADIRQRGSESIDPGSVPDTRPERRTQLLDAAFQFTKLPGALRVERGSPRLNFRSDVKAFAVCVGNGSIGISRAA